MRFVDVQCFGGGLTLGLVQAGFELAGKREQIGGFGVAQCEDNRVLLGDKWQAEACSPEEWTVPSGDVELVAGNPPCSGFSMMSVRAGSAKSRRDWRGIDASVNSCMWAHVNYASRFNDGEGPLITLFESVTGAGRDTDKGGYKLMVALRAQLEELTGHPYDLHHVFHNAASVGGASIRRRYFWVCSRIPFGIESPRIERVPTMRDAIEDLAFDGDQLMWEPQSYLTKPNFWNTFRRNDSGLVDGNMLWHKEQAHMGRVNGVLALPGGWPVGKQMVNVVEAYHQATGLWPEGWSESACATVVRTGFQGGAYQPSRWSPDKTGHVLAGNAMSTVIHPWLDRTLTHREVARVMGFPDDWRLETYTDKGGNAVYGKGVTVDCGRWIGHWVRRALEGNPGEWTGEVIGEREHLYNVSNDFKRVYNERTGEAGDFLSVALRKEIEARPA